MMLSRIAFVFMASYVSQLLPRSYEKDQQVTALGDSSRVQQQLSGTDLLLFDPNFGTLHCLPILKHAAAGAVCVCVKPPFSFVLVFTQFSGNYVAFQQLRSVQRLGSVSDVVGAVQQQVHQNLFLLQRATWSVSKLHR